MDLADEISKKLSGPLKNSLLAAALGVSAGMISQASAKAVANAAEKIANQMANDLVDDITEEERAKALSQFGPDTAPSAQPTEGGSHNSNDNFTPNPKNDIMDQTPEAPKKPASSPPPIPAAETPNASTKPHQQFDVPEQPETEDPKTPKPGAKSDADNTSGPEGAQTREKRWRKTTQAERQARAAEQQQQAQQQQVQGQQQAMQQQQANNQQKNDDEIHTEEKKMTKRKWLKRCVSCLFPPAAIVAVAVARLLDKKSKDKIKTLKG